MVVSAGMHSINADQYLDHDTSSNFVDILLGPYMFELVQPDFSQLSVLLVAALFNTTLTLSLM